CNVRGGSAIHDRRARARRADDFPETNRVTTTAIRAKTHISAAQPLELADFMRVEMTGFNESTRTSQAAIWFRGALYVGTGLAMLGFMGRYTARQGATPLAGESRFGSMRPDTGGREEDGAQVWRFDPATAEWTLVYNSPL